MTNEVIIFPDVVDIVIDWLDDNLVPPVRSRVPNPRPATFYRVQRTGGPRSAIVVDDATVVVESWADKEETAQSMAQLARGWLHALAGTVHNGVTVYQVEEFSGPGLLPDPVSSTPRYSQTFVVQTRGSAA